MNRNSFISFIFILSYCVVKGQTNQKDSVSNALWTNHFQTTVISQSHSGFKSPYSGTKSLGDSVENGATSLTATLFLGKKLWKGASFYFNSEVSGGRGLSYATGVAGALNGETYRVGAVEPQIFIARAYYQQHFALPNTDYELVKDDINQVSEKQPTNRVTISVGKFAISDFFDDNSYSKDPRTQFFNWSAWANGAWDYPANTRGYTIGLVAELVHPAWSIRLSSVAVPRIANFHLMEYNTQANSETFEFQHSFKIRNKQGNIRLISSASLTQAPSYKQGIQAIHDRDTTILNVIKGLSEHNQYGGAKFGLGINVEQELTNEIGIFGRAGWNDGKNVSWAFTEIDRTVNAGISVKGNKWKRPDDVGGLIIITNGISASHQSFLKAGGYGFIIGDGYLNYQNEQIIETYYNLKLSPFFWLTFDYQFVNNPGYNKDRGPVHIFGIRGHVSL